MGCDRSIWSTAGKVVARADDDRRANECGNADPNHRSGPAARCYPFPEGEPPKRGEQDDAGHMQRPG